MTPTISIEFDFDTAEHVLMCESHGMRPEPAGLRLFRAQPWPEVKFRHADAAEAERDAEKIRKYLAALPQGKISKKTIREHAA